MSSTNVHSEQNSNKYCASAQIIPTTPEKGLEIPPKNAKSGPTRYAVSNEELVLEISSVGTYELQDGIVISQENGGKLGKVSMVQAKNNSEIRGQRAPSKYAQREEKGTPKAKTSRRASTNREEEK